MLKDIRKELLKNPTKIVEVLENFGYCNITLYSRYIQFGRDSESSGKSIVIKIENNPYLYVKDYPRNISCELFSYIIDQRQCEFIDVLNVVKAVLKITDYYDYFNAKTIFGGFYDSIKKKISNKINTYDITILNQYSNCGNLRFLKDNISLETQRYYNIRYDVDSQGIVIPIYDQLGQIMGVKVRVNYEVEDGMQKYFYLISCLMSQTLFGYSQNYKYLMNGDIYIFESEKSVMQCHSYGFYNCVALGSSSISSKQCQMIMELNPKRVIFMHDQGLEMDAIQRNIDMLQSYSRLFEINIGYWDFNKDETIPIKASLSDLGKDRFLYGINNEIIMTGGEDYKEEL